MKTVLIVSDTHMPFMATDFPASFTKDLARCDVCIHAGDIVESDVLVRMKKVAKNIVAVQGNMDDARLRKMLPLVARTEIDGVSFGITHAAGTPHDITDRVLKTFADDLPDVCVFGHSHRAYAKKHGKTLLFNPGSLTDYLYTDANSYGIIIVEKGKIVSHEIVKV
jgi:putative phosphoesterase